MGGRGGADHPASLSGVIGKDKEALGCLARSSGIIEAAGGRVVMDEAPLAAWLSTPGCSAAARARSDVKATSASGLRLLDLRS